MNKKGLITYHHDKYPVTVSLASSGEHVNGFPAVYEAKYSFPEQRYGGRLWLLDKHFKVKKHWSSFLRFRWLTSIEGLFYNETL